MMTIGMSAREKMILQAEFGEQQKWKRQEIMLSTQYRIRESTPHQSFWQKGRSRPGRVSRLNEMRFMQGGKSFFVQSMSGMSADVKRSFSSLGGFSFLGESSSDFFGILS